MANKTINQLPNAAVALGDQFEKQVAGGGASQNATISQILTFIENSVTFFTKRFDCQQGLTVNAGAITLNNSGLLEAANATTFISANGDIEISDTTKGLILWSPNGTRYRLQVDNAGNLGTVPA